MGYPIIAILFSLFYYTGILLMKTSNFANNGRYNLNGISISRNVMPALKFTGLEFPPLMPDITLVNDYKKEKISWEFYTSVYNDQLYCLNPRRVYDHLVGLAEDIGAPEPILLCYESAKTLDKKPCHRRLVADWFLKELNINVDEWKNE